MKCIAYYALIQMYNFKFLNLVFKLNNKEVIQYNQTSNIQTLNCVFYERVITFNWYYNIENK